MAFRKFLLILSLLPPFCGGALGADGGFEQFRQDCAPNCGRDNLFDRGSDSSRGLSDDEAGRARDLDGQAGRNRDFADALDGDRQKLQDRLADASPAEREQILRGPYRPQREEHQDIAERAGVRTNASLLREGSRLAQAARKYADGQAEQARKLQRQAEEGFAAASKMEQLSRRYEERKKRLHSPETLQLQTGEGQGAPGAARSSGSAESQAASGKGRQLAGLAAGGGGRSGPGPRADESVLSAFDTRLGAAGRDAASRGPGRERAGSYADLLENELDIAKPKAGPADLLQESAELNAQLDQVLRARKGRRLASLEEQASLAGRPEQGTDLFRRVHLRLEIQQERGNLILWKN